MATEDGGCCEFGAELRLAEHPSMGVDLAEQSRGTKMRSASVHASVQSDALEEGPDP